MPKTTNIPTAKHIEFTARLIQQLLDISLAEARKMAAAGTMLEALQSLDLPVVAEPDNAEASWDAITIELTADAYLAIRAAIALATPEAG